MGQIKKLRGVASVCGIALSLAILAPAAKAFSPEVPAQSQTTPQQNANKPADNAQLADPFSAPNKSKGTEINIPGVGNVGTLPKLEFGLELLYGPQNQPNNMQAPTGGLPLDQRAQENDMQIKGSITHKF